MANENKRQQEINKDLSRSIGMEKNTKKYQEGKKDFFDRAIEKILSLTWQQWLMILAAILLVGIWAVAGVAGLVLTVIVVAIVIVLTTSYISKKKGEKKDEKKPQG